LVNKWLDKGITMTEQRKNKRRMFLVLFVIFILWGTLVGRLMWIQVIDTTSFSHHDIDLMAKSVEQRKREIVLDTGRGLILDRKGQPFTGKTVYTLVVFPLKQYPFDREPKIQELANIVGVSRYGLLSQILEMKGPTVVKAETNGQPLEISKQQAKQVSELNIAGIRAMPYNLRYGEDLIARHVIGYIGKNPDYVKKVYADELEEGTLTVNSIIGVAGLEKSFQPFLQGLGPTVVSYFVDAKGYPLRGLRIRYNQPENPYYPLSIVTTLDYEIQKAVENVMDEVGINEGAVVVLDVNNADILAMASRPNFDPGNVVPSKGNWGNRAVKQMIPGSIFKTVIAAAALEKEKFKPDDVFDDDTGSLGKYQLNSWKKGGHGKVTFQEAFAQSCNVCFAKIAMELTGDEIEEFSRKFGLLGQVGWQTEKLFKISAFNQIDGEQKGQLFVDEELRNDEGVRIQTSIGQRDVRMTPLQAANMVVTLLQRGKVYTPRLVKRIDYLNGSPFYSFPVKALDIEKPLQPYTVYQLKQWMRLVVTEGTGQELQNHNWKLAGKTGTAQVKVQGEEGNNQWFVGFAPYDAPRYVVAVVAQNLPVTANKKANIAFGKIMDELADLD
jgi:cell division protein FtsI/penicillin-binding protein 2